MAPAFATRSIWLVAATLARDVTILRAGRAEAGIPLTEEVLSDMIEEIRGNSLLDGITVSGGDPFYDPTALATLLARLRRETGLSIWCYTGYTVEYLLQSEAHRPALEFIDVLVDGPFVQSLLDPRLYFRGSRNQRLVHIDHSVPPVRGGTFVPR